MIVDAWTNAVEVLRLRGISVVPADIPGLWFVNGRELTIGQVLDYSRQLQGQK